MRNSYNPENLGKAKELRKEMTPWERKLWYLFLKDYPVHFYRKRPILSYIPDFYYSKLRFAIELDGSQHFEQSEAQYDKERTKQLNLHGIEVIRIANNEIEQNFAGVCEYLDGLIQKRTESLKTEFLTKENP